MYNYEYDNLVIPSDMFDRVSEEDKDKIKQYVYDLVNRNNWLTRKTNSTFNSRKWLYEYLSKDDLKQEFYVRIFNLSTIKNLMSRDDVSRIKYLNGIYSKNLCDLIKHNCKIRTMPLSCDLEIESNYLSDYYSDVKDIFIDDTIEKEVVELLEEGLTRDEIIEMLNISRRKFDEIKTRIKDKIKEN